MAFENGTNHRRVERAIDLLTKIEESAASNKAKAADVAEMIQPLMQRLEPYLYLARMASAETLQDRPAPAPAPSAAHGWATAVEMARNADLKDALAAMAVIATRAEQEVFEQGVK